MSRSTILGTILVTALSPARLDAQQQRFTLEQALSAPFPEELVAAPAGGAIAWVYNAQGARNLWIATPPEYQGRAVTAYTEDDGQELGELAWTPDARALVYVRGGASNSRGEYPNPLSLPAGVEQGLWIVAAGGGPPRRLGEGHSPAVSPKGDRVCLPQAGTGLVGAARRQREARAAGPRPRHRSGAALVPGRREARVRERPGRPRIHRGVRRRGQDAPVPGPERGPRRGAGVVSRRSADRVHPYPGGRAHLALHAPARRAALVDPRRGRGDRPGTGSVEGRRGSGQRVPGDRRRESAAVGRGEPPGLPLGERRLDTPVCGAAVRRRRRPVDAGGIRGRARDAHARRS